ncbi:hypothetical protein KIN20_034005 [Parelaphostrongylus tenuis]|uniref:Uncharacterized protein n=1 Tax=Parelaphostrongylus tenuis TaxID=148309 RepID=A0AAD5R970_PARTN|nr:hypothetical protein KIN20_034005 [Parelaphostrongylus tenuis]
MPSVVGDPAAFLPFVNLFETVADGKQRRTEFKSAAVGSSNSKRVLLCLQINTKELFSIILRETYNEENDEKADNTIVSNLVVTGTGSQLPDMMDAGKKGMECKTDLEFVPFDAYKLE